MMGEFFFISGMFVGYFFTQPLTQKVNGRPRKLIRDFFLVAESLFYVSIAFIVSI